MTDTQAAVAQNGTTDFGLNHLFIDKATADFMLPWMGPEAVLEVRPATGENKQYTEAMLNVSGNRQASRIIHGSKISTKDADMEREEDRAIYPGNVVVGWRNLRNKAGALVEHNLEECVALLEQIPDWLFLKIRLFCMAPENFVKSPATVQPEPAAVAEN